MSTDVYSKLPSKGIYTFLRCLPPDRHTLQYGFVFLSLRQGPLAGLEPALNSKLCPHLPPGSWGERRALPDSAMLKTKAELGPGVMAHACIPSP